MESQDGSEAAECIGMHSLTLLQVRGMVCKLVSLISHLVVDHKRGEGRRTST